MRSSEQFWHEYLLIFLKGIFMGAADIVPGVSGGTIAFITGIYTRLIDGVAYIADFLRPGSLKKELSFIYLKSRILLIDFKLFVPLGIGIGTAFVLLSTVIDYLLETQALLTFSFFFGLIVASAYFLYRKLHSFDLMTGSSLLIGAVVGILIVGLSRLNISHSLPVLFVSGAIAITAMILPGISGAFLLLIMNQYEYVLGLIRDFAVFELAVFGLGAVIGLLLFSEALHFLLHKKREITMGFLIGLMLGSLRLPVEIIVSHSPVLGDWLKVLGFVVVGFILVFVIEISTHAGN